MNIPGPDLSNSPTFIQTHDQKVRVLMTSFAPRIVMFGNVLTEAECSLLIDLSKDKVKRSTTVEDGGGEQIHPDRTSEGSFFQRGENKFVENIERRIGELLNWPVENGEGLQILRYSKGAEYKPHYDYFDPNLAGASNFLSRGGQRLATLVIYLQSATAGGSTTFPNIGAEFHPPIGGAVFFSYENPDPSSMTLHGGAPVLEGEKWVATKWLREGEFV